ncbi:MAG: ABC transporter permease [Actinobacteria bacterium]|nr:ABC transporter permease [Actinomycetota bacterium]
MIVDVITGAVRYGACVVFAAEGETVSERSGVVNLGTEGSMLTGALAAFAVTVWTGSPVIGALAGLLGGALPALLHAFLVIDRNADQLATGLSVTFLGLGVTSALGTGFVDEKISGFDPIAIPLLSEIPFFGDVLFNYDILTYVALLLGPALWWFMKKTRWGLILRATGESGDVVYAYGHSPRKVRYMAVTAGGALAGLGGAQLVLASTLNWVENITVGRGFVAVALVIFASWLPIRAALGALLFGAAVSLQLQLQARGVNVSAFLLGMTPYVLTLVVLAIASRGQAQRMPAGLKAVFAPGGT